MGDRHIYTNERYANIFEARKIKAQFLLEEMPKLVKHCVLLRYEDVRDNPKKIISNLENKFGLQKERLT